jgi:hypothetical protein
MFTLQAFETGGIGREPTLGAAKKRAAREATKRNHAVEVIDETTGKMVARLKPLTCNCAVPHRSDCEQHGPRR